MTGLGRRAKYLMADLGSGDVLLMHLGMSGSFRVIRNGGRPRRANSIIRAARTARTIMWCFTCRRGAAVIFNDPRRFGYMKIIARDATGGRAVTEGARSRAARQ